MSVSAKDYAAALRGDIILMTPAGHQAIYDKLGNLREERAKLEYDLGYAAQDYPDLRENAIYGDLSMKIQLDLPYQVDELHASLEKARIIEGPPAGKVGLGSWLTLEQDGAEYDYQLVGPVEVRLLADETKVQLVSYLSPLGRAVWGKRTGELAKFRVGGDERELRVVRHD
ncbi:MAG TPA: GreA/GreB family elongation factor [Candidatus Saccharimonas sp.]|nr:GreA/GreB family elongation factor [Candidatus Saccharimonas sp.]